MPQLSGTPVARSTTPAPPRPLTGATSPGTLPGQSSGRAASLQVGSDRSTDVAEQWEPVEAAALAVDHDLSGPPVDVVEAEGRHLPGAQAQAQQRQDDGVVTPPNSRPPVASPNNASASGRATPLGSDERRRPVIGERPLPKSPSRLVLRGSRSARKPASRPRRAEPRQQRALADSASTALVTSLGCNERSSPSRDLSRPRNAGHATRRRQPSRP